LSIADLIAYLLFEANQSLIARSEISGKHFTRNFGQRLNQELYTSFTSVYGETTITTIEESYEGIKEKDTLILTDFQIFHNYTRPHMGWLVSLDTA
jgi:hypothetical protein